MAIATAEEEKKNPLSVLDKVVRTKNTAIKVVRSWLIGVTKTTFVKFNLPFNDESLRLLPRGLREGKDRRQSVEEQRHVDYANALDKIHKTTPCREGDRPVDTADEKMETPRDGQVSASSFWAILHQENFEFVDGEWFKYIRNDGSLALVVELKFVHKNKKQSYIEALEAAGTQPTPFSLDLRERLLKNLFRRTWHRCFAYNNSAHLEPSKTYNFTGRGFPDKPMFELALNDEGRVAFVQVPNKSK